MLKIIKNRTKINNIIKILLGVFMIFFIKGCYTIKQGFYQIKLFSKSQKIYEVIQTQKESPDRLEKLNWVPKIILYAKNNLGLETGNSYTTYISLKKNEPVVYIVQAAHQRELKLKTGGFQ